MKNKFVVFESNDGLGKDSHLASLKRVLEELGEKVYLTKEPTDFPQGKYIQEIQKGLVDKPSEEKMAQLYAEDRKSHIRVIGKHLAAGEWVLCSRFKLSSLAYQGELAEEYNKGIRNPDITILLDAPVEVSLERIRNRGLGFEIYENEEKLRVSRENYLKYAKALPNVHIVDADRSFEEVDEEIVKLILED